MLHRGFEVYSVRMTEQRDPASDSADDETEKRPAPKDTGPGDSGDEANDLRFSEEEQLIHEQIRRHREERERRERMEREKKG
jgi:hypothetical protein